MSEMTSPSGVTVAEMFKRASWFAEFATFQWDPEMRRGFEAEAEFWASQAKAAAFSADAAQFAVAA